MSTEKMIELTFSENINPSKMSYDEMNYWSKHNVHAFINTRVELELKKEIHIMDIELELSKRYIQIKCPMITIEEINEFHDDAIKYLALQDKALIFMCYSLSKASISLEKAIRMLRDAFNTSTKACISLNSAMEQISLK